MRLKWVPTIILSFALFVAGVLSTQLITRWAASVAYPFQIDATEGFILQQAAAIARGESIYGRLDRPPYLVGNYPPFFQAVYGAINGPKVSLWSLSLGRRLTIGSTLIAAMLIIAIVYRMTRKPLPAVLAAFLFLVSYEVHQWSVFVRVDMPALMLTLAGLLAFVSSKRKWAMTVAGVLFTAAVFTRQTAVLAPAACVAALLTGDRRRLPWFLGPMLGTALAALASIEWATGGEFLRHIIAYNANRMDWGGWLLIMKNEIWYFYCWLVVAMVSMVVLNFWSPRSDANEDRTIRLAIAIYAFLGALSLMSYAKVGAAPNYVLEPLAATAIWLCVGVGALAGNPNRRAQIAATVVSVLILFHSAWLVHRSIIVLEDDRIIIAGALFSSPTPTGVDKLIAGGIVQYLRGVDGDVMCEEPMFTMLAGRPVLFDPFIMTTLAREAKWDPTGFIHMLEQRRFARIVTCEDLMQRNPHYERYTEAIAEAVRRHYRPVPTVFMQGVPAGQLKLPGLRRDYFIYEPAQ